MKQGLTLIITTHNSAKFIENTIHRIFNQHPTCRVLIFDDASTDTTVDITSETIKKYPNIKATVVKTSKNLGSAMARLDAIKFVKTKYIIFMDGDDLIDINVLNKLFEVQLANPEKAIRGLSYITCNSGVSPLTLNFENWEDYISFQPWHITGIIYPKDLFLTMSFIPNFNDGEDYHVFQLVFKNRIKTPLTNTPLYYWVLREGSMVHQPFNDRKMESFFQNTWDVVKSIHTIGKTKAETINAFLPHLTELLEMSACDIEMLNKIPWENYTQTVLKEMPWFPKELLTIYDSEFLLLPADIKKEHFACIWKAYPTFVDRFTKKQQLRDNFQLDLRDDIKSHFNNLMSQNTFNQEVKKQQNKNNL